MKRTRFRNTIRYMLVGMFGCCLLLSAESLAEPLALRDACPGVRRIPDVNCDGKVHMAIVGDSFVAGVGDSRLITSGRAGYVPRAAKLLRDVVLDNLGVSGLSAAELIVGVKQAFGRKLPTERLDEAYFERLRESLLSADYVVLDLGRNDRWLMGAPLQTFTTLLRIKAIIERRVKGETGVQPVVIVPSLMLPNRGSQGPWVKELNSYIIGSESGPDYTFGLRFDEVSKRLIGSDQIHPNSLGYDALARTFVAFVKRTLPRRIKASEPPAAPQLLERLGNF